MIPKIIHQIWIGPKNPPEYMSSWKHYNPNYEYILWDNQRIKSEFPLLNQTLYDLYDNQSENTKWVGKSDLLRLELLKKYGGIYIDADIECLRPLTDDLLDNHLFMVYANEKLRRGIIANGVIGCSADNELIETIISKLNTFKQIHLPPHLFSGPTFVSKIIESNTFECTVFPSYYFYPKFYANNKVADYTGDFKPYGDHKWGTTKNLYT